MSVIGTAGHVDHGKSALIRRLTGIDPDRLEEERRRGLTIDLGFASLRLPSGREVGVIDVPGHERFIRNMLAGAGGASACLFVVAANEGWREQSTEHLAAVHLLGIETAVVALTKSDLVPEDSIPGLKSDIADRLRGSNLESAEIVPCSALTGAGVERLIKTLERALGASAVSESGDSARMWIDRSFSISGAGTIVTGTLEGATLRTSELVTIVGHNKALTGRIRGLQSHQQDRTEVPPQTRTAINLVGIEHHALERGDAICTGPWPSTDRINVTVSVLDEKLAGRSYELSGTGSHLLYVGTAEVEAKITLLGRETLRSGHTAPAQIKMRRGLPLRRGDRFVLRDSGRNVTFGGGVVVDALPERARKSDLAVAELVSRMSTSDDTAALGLLLDHSGELPIEAALARTNAMTAPRTVRLGRRLVSGGRFFRLKEDVHGALAVQHDVDPLSRLTKAALCAQLGLDQVTGDALLELMPEVVQMGPTIRLASQPVLMSAEQLAMRKNFVATLERSGFSPPPTSSLVPDRSFVNALELNGDVISFGKFHLTKAQAETMKDRVRGYLTGVDGISVATIRDLLNTSRRYAVPLCEWMDDVGFTRRSGDLRYLGPKS